MPKFFTRNRILTCTGMGLTSSSSRTVSTYTKKFHLADEIQPRGSLIKVILSDSTKEPSSILDFLKNAVVRKNPNSLFIWTTPTHRMNSQHDELVYPGHNFSSTTDKDGETACFLSKRPDTNAVLGERRRIVDLRFTKQNRMTTLFRPYFSSVEEEIEKWVKRASAIPDYPLYIHVIPLETLDLDINTYKENVDYLIEMEEPYTLFSTRHPFSDHYIRASNCNSATEQAIFGVVPPSVHDMSCQEAAMEIVTRLLKKPSDYLQHSADLGLTKGIESPTIVEDLYRAGFSC